MKKIDSRQDVFCDVPVVQAVLKLAIPTVVSQIIMVVYNISDIFIVGLCNSDVMLTATTICSPVFLILNAIANLFGVGGSTLISRALGRKNYERAKDASSFAFFSCLILGLIYCLLVYLNIDWIIDVVGGINTTVHSLAKIYLVITVCLGGIFTILASLFAHLIRAEGRNNDSSFGLILGAVLNMIFDPILMFVILPEGNEVLGTSIGTALANFISFMYYVIKIISYRKDTYIRFRFNKNIIEPSIVKSVFKSGLPAFIMTLFENISFAILDYLMAFNGVLAQAGLGVAKKLNMLAHSIVRGISQGVMPLISYNYAAKNKKRYRDALKVTMIFSIGMALLCTLVCFVLAPNLVEIFIHTDSSAVNYGAKFLRILCLGAPFSACLYTFISFFEAIGRGEAAFVLALLRKGAIDIPLMFILNSINLYGIVIATPATDVIGCFASLIVYQIFIHYND